MKQNKDTDAKLSEEQSNNITLIRNVVLYSLTENHDWILEDENVEGVRLDFGKIVAPPYTPLIPHHILPIRMQGMSVICTS